MPTPTASCPGNTKDEGHSKEAESSASAVMKDMEKEIESDLKQASDFHSVSCRGVGRWKVAFEQKNEETFCFLSQKARFLQDFSRLRLLRTV